MRIFIIFLLLILVNLPSIGSEIDSFTRRYEHLENLKNEIDLVNKMLSETVEYDVVMDFGGVKLLTSATICGLMILDRLLRGGGRQFVLCNVPPEIKQVFNRTGLMSVFEFSDDQQVALEEVKSRRMSWAGA